MSAAPQKWSYSINSRHNPCCSWYSKDIIEEVLKEFFIEIKQKKVKGRGIDENHKHEANHKHRIELINKSFCKDIANVPCTEKDKILNIALDQRNA